MNTISTQVRRSPCIVLRGTRYALQVSGAGNRRLAEDMTLPQGSLIREDSMKRFVVFASILGLVLSSVPAQAGNGAPSGAHYNLNIIGVPKGKTADMTGDNGHRIFVPATGSAKINLRQGDFQVLDANGTDGNGAAFQLPAPDPDGDGIAAYSVYARALGKPGGSSTMTTCVTDLETLIDYCSTEQVLMVRSTGKSSFTNVSRELLTAYVDTDGDGVMERISLFSDATLDYYWQYDNNGLKLLQLRFYEIPTSIN
jgi:hypothetical protein